MFDIKLKFNVAFSFDSNIRIFKWQRWNSMLKRSHAECLMFEYRPRHTLVSITGSYSSTAICSLTGVSVTGHRR